MITASCGIDWLQDPCVVLVLLFSFFEAPNEGWKMSVAVETFLEEWTGTVDALQTVMQSMFHHKYRFIRELIDDVLFRVYLYQFSRSLKVLNTKYCICFSFISNSSKEQIKYSVWIRCLLYLFIVLQIFAVNFFSVWNIKLNIVKMYTYIIRKNFDWPFKCFQFIQKGGVSFLVLFEFTFEFIFFLFYCFDFFSVTLQSFLVVFLRSDEPHSQPS